MSQRRFPRVSIGLLALALLASVVHPTAVDASNRLGAKACQKNGWTTLYTTEGGRFADQAACVSYAARGGVLATAPPVSLAISFVFNPGSTMEQCLTSGGSYCTVNVSVAGSGLLPGSQVTWQGAFGLPFQLFADASGNVASLIGQVGCEGTAIVTVRGTSASGAPYSTSAPAPACSEL